MRKKVSSWILIFVLILAILATPILASGPPNISKKLVGNFIPFNAFKSEYKVDGFTRALWHFNENQGYVTYDETGVNDGIVNGADWVDGKFYSALEFYSFTEDVLVQQDLSIEFDAGEDFTFECWAYIPQKYPHQWLGKRFCLSSTKANIGYEFGFYHSSSSAPIKTYVRFFNGVNEVMKIGNKDVTMSKWHHLAVVRENGVITVYLDGVKDGNQPIFNKSLITGEAVFIGKMGVNTFFKIIIDEMRISNKARSISEFNI